MKEKKAMIDNKNSNIFLLNILIVFCQKMQTKIVENPKIKNLTNVTKKLGSIRPKEWTPKAPEKKVNPKIIKIYSPSLRNLITVSSPLICLNKNHVFDFY
ncbi:MAG: hypothetical protein QNJ51_29235 [Calothrix sp. MO_167.B12]|nr:hypothetical protein [Calothrix sp. MO_167.B12]